jgi:uncharacterized protein YkwD
LPVAFLIAASAFAVIVVFSDTNSDAGSAVRREPDRISAVSFGQDLRVAFYAEAVEEARVTAALQELSALQQLAGLAAWPPPYVPPAPGPAPRAARVVSAPPPRPAPWTDASFSAAVFDAVNARRAAAGLPALRWDGRIAQASSSYALRMTALGAFGHSVDGSTISSRLAAAGFTDPVMLGEVIAFSSGSASPDSVVQMWMDSPAHREQNLSGNYRLAGAGCAFYGGDVRCVVDLAG